MSYCELETVEMSDLELHIKALDLLIAYSESEQYDPVLDSTNILMSNLMVLAELRYMKEHIIRYHDGVRDMEIVDMIHMHIQAISDDDKHLRAIIHVRGVEGM